jgi:hypothetical protein
MDPPSIQVYKLAGREIGALIHSGSDSLIDCAKTTESGQDNGYPE